MTTARNPQTAQEPGFGISQLIMRNNVRGLGYATSLEWTLRSAWRA